MGQRRPFVGQFLDDLNVVRFNNLVLLIFDVHCEGTESIRGGRIRCTTGQVRVIVGDLVALDV